MSIWKLGTKADKNPKRSSLDVLKWIVIIAAAVAGVVANIHYGTVAGSVRTAVGIVAFLILLSLFFSTVAGHQAMAFIKGAQVEMRKVVWPTRQETVQMTLVVMVVLVIASLVLWAVDGLFLWLVGLLTGQGG